MWIRHSFWWFKHVLSASQWDHWCSPGWRRALHQWIAHWFGHSQPFQVGFQQGGTRLSPGKLKSMQLPNKDLAWSIATLKPLLLCFCSILDILRREARILEGLYSLGIKGEHQADLLKLPVNTIDDSYALDIRHPAIMVSPVKHLYCI